MKKNFINDCMFFRGKDPMFKILGIIAWCGFIQFILAVFRIIY